MRVAARAAAALEDGVTAALRGVQDPVLCKDVVTLGYVKVRGAALRPTTGCSDAREGLCSKGIHHTSLVCVVCTGQNVTAEAADKVRLDIQLPTPAHPSKSAVSCHTLLPKPLCHHTPHVTAMRVN